MSMATRGGPKTRAGKKNSSRNALKHGMTSIKLLSSEEQTRCDYLEKMLREEYGPKTITEELYISKIASLQIRLDRVIQAEQADIALAQKHIEHSTSIIDTLDIDDDAKKEFVISNLAGLYDDASDETIKLKRFQMAVVVDLSHLLGREDFLSYEIIEEKYPLVDYVIEATAFREDKQISEIFSLPPEEQDKLISKMATTVGFGDNKEQIKSIVPHTEDLQEISSNVLRAFLAKLFDKLRAIKLAAWVAGEFDNLRKLHIQSAMPESAAMDRYMRYSTTLNNQLSKAIGELRHIIKERKAEERTLSDK